MFIPSIRLIIYYARDETLIIVIKLTPTRRQSIFHSHLCTAHMYRINGVLKLDFLVHTPPKNDTIFCLPPSTKIQFPF